MTAAKSATVHRTRSVIKVGKYPFDDFAKEYVEKMKITYSAETVANRARRYRRMGNLVKTLKEQKKISTMSPKHFNEDDVYTFLVADRAMRSVSDFVHEVNALKKLLLYVDNPALELCLNHHPEIKPRMRGNRRKGSMSDESYDIILEHGRIVDPTDFKRLRAYALVLLCLDTGTRNKEIRLALVDDLDLNSWTLNIEHVKGEDTYGEPRAVPIREEVRPVVKAYLNARAKWVLENGCLSKALFPSNSKKSKDGFMCGNSLRRIKDIVVEDTNVKFDLRECRRTFGQRYINDELGISSVSVLMGHASTKTTERFYGRQKNISAIQSARETWSKGNVLNKDAIVGTQQETTGMVDNASEKASVEADKSSADSPSVVSDCVQNVPNFGFSSMVDKNQEKVDNA